MNTNGVVRSLRIDFECLFCVCMLRYHLFYSTDANIKRCIVSRFELWRVFLTFLFLYFRNFVPIFRSTVFKHHAQTMNEENAALILQKTWRGWHARSKYAQAQTAVLRIQAYVRGFLARKVLFFFLWIGASTDLLQIRQQSRAFRARADQMDYGISLGQQRAAQLQLEFEVLSSLPADRLEHYFLLRRRFCAQRIERWWRQCTGRPPYGTQVDDGHVSAESDRSSRHLSGMSLAKPRAPTITFNDRLRAAFQKLSIPEDTTMAPIVAFSRENMFIARVQDLCGRCDLLRRDIRASAGVPASVHASLELAPSFMMRMR
jgi:hypothetical protein